MKDICYMGFGMALLSLIHIASTNPNETASGGNDTREPEEETETEGVRLADFNFEHVREPIMFCIILLLTGVTKIAFHRAKFLSSKVPESCLLIMVGIAFGSVIHFSGIGSELPTFFEPREFFLVMLPPIILEAAYSLHDRVFAENIGSILIFAVLGTILNAFFIALTLHGIAIIGGMGEIQIDFVQLLVFTSLIAAVDPVAVLAVFQEVGVNRVLYFLVFGESLLNDGVTVVLYKVLHTFNDLNTITWDQVVLGVVKFFVVVLGGLAIGIIIGLLTAIVTKYTRSVKVIEPIAVFGLAYLSYILAEMFEFSGIISCIGCGLVQAQYAFHNVTNKSRGATKYFIKLISTLMEIVIFIFLGITVMRQNHVWHTGFILWTLFWCFIYRFLITFVFSFLINKFDRNRVRKIGLDEMFIISYGGLRGGVCFSLVVLLEAEKFPQKDLFVTATMAVVFFTVFVQGITMKPLVRLLRIQMAADKQDKIMEELNTHISDHVMAGIEEIIGHQGHFYLRSKFDYLENRYFRRWFLKFPKHTAGGTLTEYYEKLVMKEHYKNLQLCGASKMPHVPDDLPLVDSEAYLNKLTVAVEGVDEREDEDEKSSSDGSLTVELQSITTDDLRRLLSHIPVQQMMMHAKYNKYMAQEDKWGMLQLLHNKRIRLKNLQASRANQRRRRSWSDDQADVTLRRGKAPEAIPRPQTTIGLSSLSRGIAQDTARSAHISPYLWETVMEERDIAKETHRDIAKETHWDIAKEVSTANETQNKNGKQETHDPSGARTNRKERPQSLGAENIQMVSIPSPILEANETLDYKF